MCILCQFLLENKDDVFVGRIRRDFSNKKTLNMWVVSDNLRKEQQQYHSDRRISNTK